MNTHRVILTWIIYGTWTNIILAIFTGKAVGAIANVTGAIMLALASILTRGPNGAGSHIFATILAFKSW